MADFFWIAGTTIGGGSAVWDNAANWASSSGGAGGFGVPGEFDNAIFDGNGIDECVPDIDIHVNDLILTGAYDGAGGTDGNFNNGTNNQNIRIDGDYSAFNDAVHAGSGTWDFYGGLVDSSGSGGSDSVYTLATANIRGAGAAVIGRSHSTGSWGTMVFKVDSSVSGQTGVLALIVELGVTVTITSGRLEAHTGPNTIAGDVTGPGELRFDGTGGITTLTGTCDVAVVKVQRGGCQFAAATWDCASFNFIASGTRNLTFLAGTTTFNGDFIRGTSGTVRFDNSVNNPSFVFKGAVDLSAGTVVYTKGSGTVTLSGDAAQAINFDGHVTEEIEIAKPAETATFGAGVTCDAFLGTQGTVDFNGQTINVVGDFTMLVGSQLSGDQGGALLIVGGMLSLTGEPFARVVINNLDFAVTAFALASYCNVTLSDASAGSEICAENGTNIDGGGNINWVFPAQVPILPAPDSVVFASGLVSLLPIGTIDMTTILDYQGRRFDVMAFQGAQAAGTAKLRQELFNDDVSGTVATGSQKLAQRFVLEFLTEKGSMIYLPDRGTEFMTKARAGFLRSEQDVMMAFNFALIDIRQNLLAEEELYNALAMQDDEKFANAALQSMSLLADQLKLTIVVASQAGQNRQIILPISTTPIDTSF